MRTVLLAILIALPFAAPAQNALYIGGLDASGYPELRISLRLVENNRVVFPLDASRIVLRENGRLLPVSMNCPEPVKERPSLGIGFERSLDGNFTKEIAAARLFLARMGFTDDGAEASLWSFATTVDQELTMTRDSSRLRSAVDGLSSASWPLNGTALYETMHRAIEDVNASGSGTRKSIVFFTDGYNNTTWFSRSWDQVLGRAAVDNIRIYVILAKNRTDGEDAMRTLSEASGGFMVYESDPNAADSVYRALIEPDLSRLWCEVSVQSPLCANGETRSIAVGYVRSAGDTLWTTATYQAPDRPNELQPLAVWCSPPDPLPGDTLQTVAIGVQLTGGWQPPAFTLALPLNGMKVAGVTDGAWPVNGNVIGDNYLLTVVPPASGLNDGYYTIARIMLQGPPSSQPWQPLLIAEPTSCLRLEAVKRPASARIALDTVLSARRSTARLPLHVLSHDLPEGVQLIDLELRVDTALAQFDAAAPWEEAALPAQWTTRTSAVRLEGSDYVLALRLDGPGQELGFDAGAAVLQLRSDPAYLVPVRLGFAQLNLHADAAMEDGLLVMRDSCRNNVVAIAGLAPAKPWPQPAQDVVTLRLTAAGPQSLRITVIDALGRDVLALPPQVIAEGVTDMPLDISSLHSGTYSIQYHTSAGVLTQPLIVTH
ncbi:MAG: VWA domain-containing protein [Bacteroidota bacterium]